MTSPRPRVRCARPLSLAALACGLVLAACSGGTETDPSAEPAAAGGEDSEGNAAAAPADLAQPGEAPAAKPPASKPAAAKPAAEKPAAEAEGASSAASAQAPAPKRASGPKIVVEKTVHDFGSVYDIEMVKATFPFRNAGDEKLVISDVKASCGCTALALDRKVFEPGEGDEIRVEFTPKGIGRQTKTIDIVSNSAREPVVRLEIAAVITEFVRFEPRSLQFGKMAVGEEHEMTADVLSLDPNLQITSLVTQNPHLEASLLPGAVSETPGAHSVVRLTLKPSAPWGSFRTTLLMSVRGTLPNGEDVDHRVTGSVMAELYGKVQADPAFFAVGAVEPGAAVEHEMTLAHTEGKPFEVVEARLEGMSFEGLELTPERTAEGMRLRLHGPTGDYLGNVRGRAVVRTDVPGEPEMTFHIMGIVRDFTEKDYAAQRMREARERAEAQRAAQERLRQD